MPFFRPVLVLVVLASFGTNAFFVWSGWRSTRQAEVQLVSPDAIEVIRTRGGLLQVSTIRSPETFQATTDHRFLGIDLGRTTTQIRVPAMFSYHVELAPEWKATVRGDHVVVIAPAVKPTLPVAIDTAKLERFSSGTWSLFTGTAELDALQRSITETLAVKAAKPSYLEFQREAARSTVSEFVSKWLLTQARFQDHKGLRVHVFFEDEPIQALNTVSPVLVAPQ